MVKKYILIITIFCFSLQSSYADGVGVGASAIYNFQTESFGAGFRLNFMPSNMFRIIPQAAYYPSFNKIHEYYAGVGLELNLFKVQKYNFYLLGHGAFNGWLNHETSEMKDAEYGNWALEAGVGIVKNKGCFRPFAEFRYNGNWKETNARVGIMFVFGCKKGRFSGRKKGRKRSAVSCPAYN